MPYAIPAADRRAARGTKKTVGELSALGALGHTVMEPEPYPPKKGQVTKGKPSPVVRGKVKVGKSKNPARRMSTEHRAFAGKSGY